MWPAAPLLRPAGHKGDIRPGGYTAGHKDRDLSLEPFPHRGAALPAESRQGLFQVWQRLFSSSVSSKLQVPACFAAFQHHKVRAAAVLYLPSGAAAAGQPGCWIRWGNGGAAGGPRARGSSKGSPAPEITASAPAWTAVATAWA